MEMKKYMTPEMEVVELDYQKPLLDGSGSVVEQGGAGNPDEPLD